MSDRFVLFNEKFLTSSHSIDDVVATAPDEAAAISAGSAPGLSSQYTWVEFQFEEDGVTLCNGVARPDLPPRTS